MRPNIILISLDTQRADHMSCYGYGKHTTPNIDRLAQDGTVFRRNYSTGVWTPPGHASMLTGLYVTEHGVHGEGRLHESIPTIADTLKGMGYQTAGYVNNSQVGELVGLQRGHDTFVEVWKGIQAKTLVERVARGVARRVQGGLGYLDMGASRTNRLFSSWIETGIDRKKPFYAFLHYIEPHNPLDPPRPYKAKYLKPGLLDDVDMKKVEKVAYNPLICFIEDIKLNENEIRVIKALYDGEVEYTDSKVGELVELLKKNGLYDDTMIIITADHGEHFGEHGLWSHVASLYKEVLHIPLIIKFPKGMKRAGEVNKFTQLVDIFPTVMEVAGRPGASPGATSGASLVFDPGNDSVYHDCVFAEWEGRIPYFIQSGLNGRKSETVEKFKNKMWMVFDGRYKYISALDGAEELYDLESDSDESNNIVKVNKSDAARLRSRLTLWKSSACKRSPEEARHAVDEETKRNLESLGYL